MFTKTPPAATIGWAITLTYSLINLYPIRTLL
jgi:hypothetical protein